VRKIRTLNFIAYNFRANATPTLCPKKQMEIKTYLDDAWTDY